jgi:hypothetical protein
LSHTRRRFLGTGAAGLVLTSIAGELVWTTPADAAERKGGFRTLTAFEAEWLGGLGEAIAPPSKAGGLAHYVDHHLGVPHADCLLGLRYLDVQPPYLDFYRPALASLARLGGGGSPPAPGDARWTALLVELAKPAPPGWAGPPAPLFLFAVRLDAIDIAYGTRAGFARLGVEYLAHVEPERDW